MTSTDEGRRTSRLVGGGLLVIVGTLLVLQNLHVLDAGRIFDYWPLLLVWVGVTRLLAPNRGRHIASGAILLTLGIAFLADRFDWVDFSMRDFWPILLVIAGIAMIAEGIVARGARAGSAPSSGGPS
jgi:membrane-associated PAP2 superfamily phosphatase